MSTEPDLSEVDPGRLADLLGLPQHVAPLSVMAGSAGRLWSGRDRRLGKDVVIKVLAAGEGVRFEAETRAMARLGDHPNVAVPTTVGHGRGGVTWLVSEKMASTLAVAGRDAATGRVLDWAGQLAHALCHAHGHGVAHGDVTPANVLVAPDGTIRLSDFGSARLVAQLDGPHGADAVDATRGGGTPTGHTPRYAAPERRRGSAASTASDMFGFGATVDAVLSDATGRVPLRTRRLLRRCTRSDPGSRPDAAAVVRATSR